MINKSSLDALKNYKVNDDNIYDIAKLFPMMLGNVLRMMYVYITPSSLINLSYKRENLMQFEIKFGYAMMMHKYDDVDNVLLDFLESYHYGLQGTEHIWHIKFKDTARNRFIEICNGFAGKKWNDIIEPFIDALYLLFSSATIEGKDVNLN